MVVFTPISGRTWLAVCRGRRVSTVLSWVLLLALVPLLGGCNYYRKQKQETKPEELSQLASSKYFIIHEGTETWQLTAPRVVNEQLEGLRGAVDSTLVKYSKPIQASPRFKLRDKAAVLNLVHIFISSHQTGEGQQVSIPLSAVQQLDVVEKDSGKTTVSYVFGTLGVIVGALTVVTIIIALTKSSCPFVYAYDGQSYQFMGETYGGAIFAPSERDDYMPLPNLKPQGQQYQLKITNELRERQYTNLAELWVVEHPSTMQVLLDQRGGVHTLGTPQTPTHAVSDRGMPYTKQLAAPDKNVVLFNDPTPGTSRNSLILTFDNPSSARQGKLVLRAQNSLWLDYLYGEFTKKFGAHYTTWARTQHDVPPQELRQWALDQGIHLNVSVETPQGWQPVETIPPVGPLAYRDLVVPLNLPATEPGKPVRVKLETGFMFWELDYAALDLSPDQPVQVDRYQPHTARDEQGRDQRPALLHDDGQYLQQLHPGTEVRLTYQGQLPPASAATRTTSFLHTKGYYEPIRNYEGLPNLAELYSFRRPGRFIEFSKERYQQVQEQSNPVVASR
ncbi:hypothetical protein [Hymenobacter seoulensis]